ncbi:MAG: hypothetical protein MZV63_08895 [Marinilabiliales bacterium]|nr:hypothetical protein [Marinilabiliales bacterium]
MPTPFQTRLTVATKEAEDIFNKGIAANAARPSELRRAGQGGHSTRVMTPRLKR